MAQGTTAAADAAQSRAYNPKWRCYLLICVASLTNFVSVRETRNADLEAHYHLAHTNMDVFGMVTFGASLLILILDLIGFVRNKFDFQTLKDGKVEGCTIFLFLLWWTGGVIAITRAGAIGYAALNIYFSAWASFFACLWTLDVWGGEKDILTLKQLAGISITLPYWWVVFWASIVILGTAADARRLGLSQYVLESSTFAIWESVISSIVSGFFVMSHYDFFPCCLKCASWLTYGGVFELIISVFLNIWLVIGLDQLTGVGSLGSTINGNGGSDPSAEDYIPGSNLYISIWSAFIASCLVTVRWKEARAIRFAQTSGDSTIAEEDEEGFDESEDAEMGGAKKADDSAGVRIAPSE
ncbi:hypothetical protein ACHAXT_010917 [Thalassiosira profunda]